MQRKGSSDSPINSIGNPLDNNVNSSLASVESPLEVTCNLHSSLQLLCHGYVLPSLSEQFKHNFDHHLTSTGIDATASTSNSWTETNDWRCSIVVIFTCRCSAYLVMEAGPGIWHRQKMQLISVTMVNSSMDDGLCATFTSEIQDIMRKKLYSRCILHAQYSSQNKSEESIRASRSFQSKANLN